jgi:hypothetical protein
MVTYADLGVYIAKDGTEIDLAADGGEDCRITIPAGSNLPLLIPWSGLNVYFLNTTGSETPTIHVLGIP